MVAERLRDRLTDILARELNNQYQTRACKSQASRNARRGVCGKKRNGIDHVVFNARQATRFRANTLEVIESQIQLGTSNDLALTKPSWCD
jgi:hypothetical protein